jgi:hypothetical protein
MNEDDQTLHDAGYRRAGPVWLKPLGFTVLLYDPATRQWDQRFRTLQGEIMIYAKPMTWEPSDDEAFPHWLAWCESQAKPDILAYEGVEPFHFRTELQIAGLS